MEKLFLVYYRDGETEIVDSEKLKDIENYEPIEITPIHFSDEETYKYMIPYIYDYSELLKIMKEFSIKTLRTYYDLIIDYEVNFSNIIETKFKIKKI